MRFLAVSAFLGLLAVQQAAAGASDSSDWQCSPGFPICSKSPNQCTNPQKGGISCAESSQPTSGSCSGVGGMGVQNANYGTMKCNSKKKLLVRGGGASSGQTDQKCVKQTCGTTKGSGITVHKGSGSQYSCNAHQIVVEQPTVVQITHYNEESGQQCSYHQMCNANEITTISNENCGSSDYHEVCVHPSSPSGPNVPIGVVGMNFECKAGPSSSCTPSLPATSNAPASSKPVSPPVSSAPSPIESGSTAPVVSTPSPVSSTPSPVVSTPSPIESGSTAPIVSTPSPVSSTPSPIVSTPSPIESGSTAPVVSTPSPVSSTPSPIVSTPSPIESGTTSPSVTPSSPSPIQLATSSAPVQIETQSTSLITYTTLTSCPVTSTTVISGSTSIIVKTSLITSTITTCTRCEEKTPTPTPIQQGSTPPAPPPSSPIVPAPPVPTTTAPGSPQEVGTTASVPSPPPVVYTSTPAVITTTTEIVLTTLTTCPVTLTTTAPHQTTPTTITTTTVSTVLTTSTSTITTTTLSPPPASPSAVASPSEVVPPAQPSPPPAFKGCISAWYDLKGCGSNTDYDCYCKQDEVTTKVYECITNYEQDVSLQAQAMASYQGLCAQHIPQHPAIVTKSVELIPTPASTPAGSSPAVVTPPVGVTSAPAVPVEAGQLSTPAGSSPAVVTPPVSVTSAPAAPVEAGQLSTTTAPAVGSPAPTPAPSSSVPSTTIPVSVTVTVPCSVAAGLANQISDGQVQEQATGVMAPGCTTTSLLSTQLAVPQMHFATSGTSVGLAAGTPAANEAGATAAAVPAPVPGVAGASGTVSVPASSAPPAPTSTTFHGAAVKTSHSGVFLSVVLAAVGLVVYA